MSRSPQGITSVTGGRNRGYLSPGRERRYFGGIELYRGNVMDDLAVRIRTIAEEIQALQQELAPRLYGAEPVDRRRGVVAERFRRMYERLQELLLVHPPTPLPVRSRRLHHAPRPD